MTTIHKFHSVGDWEALFIDGESVRQKPLADHDRTREVPDSGPAGTWHYRYQCDDGFIPPLERDTQ